LATCNWRQQAQLAQPLAPTGTRLTSRDLQFVNTLALVYWPKMVARVILFLSLVEPPDLPPKYGPKHGPRMVEKEREKKTGRL